MAAQYVVVIDVTGVAGIACDGGGWIAKPVVVVGQRDDSRPPFDSDLAFPGRGESVDSKVDEELDGVGSGVAISEVAKCEVGCKLLGGERGEHGSPLAHRRSSRTPSDRSLPRGATAARRWPSGPEQAEGTQIDAARLPPSPNSGHHQLRRSSGFGGVGDDVFAVPRSTRDRPRTMTGKCRSISVGGIGT